MKLQWALPIEKVRWNGEKNRFEIEAVRDVIREMCDHQVKNFLGKLVWCVKVKTVELIDMDKYKIIRTMKIKPSVSLVEEDTLHMLWNFFIEECIPTDDVEVGDYRDKF
jgi:hypothetical protein